MTGSCSEGNCPNNASDGGAGSPAVAAIELWANGSVNRRMKGATRHRNVSLIRCSSQTRASTPDQLLIGY